MAGPLWVYWYGGLAALLAVKFVRNEFEGRPPRSLPLRVALLNLAHGLLAGMALLAGPAWAPWLGWVAVGGAGVTLGLLVRYWGLALERLKHP